MTHGPRGNGKPQPTDLLGPPTARARGVKVPDFFEQSYLGALVRARHQGRSVPSPEAYSVWLFLKSVGGRWGMWRKGLEPLRRALIDGPGWRIGSGKFRRLVLVELVRSGYVAAERRDVRRAGCRCRWVLQVQDPPGLAHGAVEERAARRKESDEYRLAFIRNAGLAARYNEPERFKSFQRETGLDYDDAVLAFGQVEVDQGRAVETRKRHSM